MSLASLEEGGFSWVSPQLLQAADVAGKKKKKLGVAQDQVLGLQRAQAHYHPPARGALIPFCEDRQRGSDFWSLSAASPHPEYLGGASPEKMLQGGAGPLTSELQLGRVAGPLQVSGTSVDGKRKAEMCQQTHPRTKMLEIPRVLTCNSQDPPSLLPDPPKASSGCSGERWDAGPWARAQSPSAGRVSGMGFYLGQREGTSGAESVCGFGSAKTKE